jgi:hypothetical protein
VRLCRSPDNPNRPRDAAFAHKYIAGRLITNEDAGGAFAHLKTAEVLDESLVRVAPNDPEHKMDLAIDLSQWGESVHGRSPPGGNLLLIRDRSEVWRKSSEKTTARF